MPQPDEFEAESELLIAARHFGDILVERNARPHPGAGPRPPTEVFESLEATERWLLATGTPPDFAKDAAPLCFWTYRMIQARKADKAARGE